jgi:hypothetical protein
MSELSAVRTSLTGEMLIGGTAVQGDTGEWRAVNPATGECLLPVCLLSGHASRLTARGACGCQSTPDVAALEWRIG